MAKKDGIAPSLIFQSLRENGEALNAIKFNKFTQTFSSRSEASNLTNLFVLFLPSGTPKFALSLIVFLCKFVL